MRRPLQEPPVSVLAQRVEADHPNGTIGTIAQRIGRRVPSGVIPLVIVAGLIISPLIAIAYGATEPGLFQGNPHFSFAPLINTYTSPDVWRSLAGTMALATSVGVVSTAAGTVLAWLVTRTNLPLRGLLEVIIISTLFTSPFVASIAWFSLGAPRSGLINVIASAIAGHDVQVIDLTSFGGVAWVLILHYLPYVYLFAQGALQNVDASLEEASYVNGYGASRTLGRITLRLIFPTLASAFIFVVILSAGDFSVPAVLGRTLSFVPLPVLIYDASNGFIPDFAGAASVASVLFLVCLALYLIYRQLTRRERRYVTLSGRGFRGGRLDLGRSRHAIAGLIVLYGVVSTVVPNAALVFTALTPFQTRVLQDVHLTLGNFSKAFAQPAVSAALLNTLLAVVGATALCCGLALASVFGARRASRPVRAGLDHVSNLPLAVPGIVLGIGLIWVYVRTPIYATVALLIVGFVTHYFPQAFRILRNGSMQLDGSLEEASFVNGAGRFRTARKVTVPLLTPALFSAVVLTAIFTIRELNVAILLYAPNSQVISVITWDLISNGSLEVGAVLAIVQTVILVAVLVVARLVFRVRVGRPV